VVSDRGGVLVIDDPLSLLSAIIWLAALGTWPVGFLFGACSACCDQDQCPWMLNFDRCLYFDNVNTSPQTGGTTPVSLRKFGGTGEAQYMGPGVGELEIHNAQSHIRITVRVSISASGASRTPIGETRTQVWRFNRATPTTPASTAYDVLGPAWHLEVELGVTGVATQAEAGVTTSIGVDSEGQPKLFVVVNQWTATITRDEVVTLFPVGLQRWGPGLTGTQTFRLSGATATATRVSGDNYSGWTVSKLSGITILSRALAVRLDGRITLNEGSAIDFLNGDSTITSTVREFSILPNNVLCSVGASNTSVGVALGLYSTTATLNLDNPKCGDSQVRLYLRQTVSDPGTCNSQFITGYARLRRLLGSNSPLPTFFGGPADFFCGSTILWNLINGQCRDSFFTGNAGIDADTNSSVTGNITLGEASPTVYDNGFGTCPEGYVGLLNFCIEIVSLSEFLNNGNLQAFGALQASNFTLTSDGKLRVSFEFCSFDLGGNICEFFTTGLIEDPCQETGSITFDFSSEFTFIVPTGTSYITAERGNDPLPPVFTTPGPCAMTSVTVDGITANDGVSIASATVGQCFYARPVFTDNTQCGNISHSVPCGGCTPEVTIVEGAEYARVTYLASGEKAELIEIIALSTWLAGQGVTFTVTCGNDSITHTLRRAFEVPSPPRNLTVVRGPCSEAFLEWQVPESSGGTPITAYSVQFRRIGVSGWTIFGTVSPPALSATVTGLVRVGYEFRVLAVNIAGTSAQSNIAVDGFALGAATNLTFTRDPCDQVQLSWTAPAQSECVVVAGYRVQYNVLPFGSQVIVGTVDSTETTVTITGLDPTLRYRLIVVRIADDGSETLASVDSGTFPANPTSVVGSLTQNAGEVNLVWDAVEQQCFPNTDYLVQFRPSTTSTWSDFARPASANKFATVTGLTAGVTYFFRVRATNSVGNSGFSAQSQPVSIPFE
jgi:hypothetical protein